MQCVSAMVRYFAPYQLNPFDLNPLRDMGTLNTLTKLNAQAPFLTALRDAGRQQAAAWLETNGAALGARSTYDLSPLLG